MAKAFQLSGRLPKTERNGLDAHEEEFLHPDAPAPMIAIALIERKHRKVDDDTDEVTALAKISHIEIVSGEESKQLAERLREISEARSGDTPLDVDVEEGEVDFEAPLVAVDDDFAPLDDSFGGDQ